MTCCVFERESKNRKTMIQKILKIKTSELIPYAGNSRTHSDEQVTQIAASIKEFGFNNPVLIDSSNGIIAGHGRVMAAQKLGIDEVPTICLDHLSDSQRRAYVIADNKIALNSGWDEEALAAEIDRLIEDGVNISLTGFSAMEIDDLLEAEEAIEEAEEIIHEQSLQVEPAKEYILIMAKDADEWDEMVEFFKLKKVRRGGYKSGSAFDSIGTERVLKFERIKNANCDTK